MAQKALFVRILLPEVLIHGGSRILGQATLQFRQRSLAHGG